ncbi:MAG: tetratricopeptide repeat protein [Caldilineaceae bacterium]|nr:tetratricopeptide repeat protein [Caldilineaceae bacterium]MBP8110559.1 tetratricopeptide repeat protein [Caldilineaceae bacterium]MBP8125716.1 tetratricopeptide repeat protein [Caldilineaceae bacterium]MBP9074164.1 tetratricopeptide repeat protein [Caldilineaceae bacterium]
MLRTKLDHWCEAIIEAGWLAALIVTPLFFNVFSSRVFEPDKISLVRTTALIMLLAWLIKLINGGPAFLPAHGSSARSGEDQAEPAAEQSWLGRMVRTPFVLPVLLILFSYGISTALSVAPRVSWWGSYQRLQGTYTFVSYVIIALLTAAHLRTPDQIRRLQHTVILTSLPIAIYGIVQKMQLDPLPWGGDVVERVAGNAGNAIFLSAYLIMAFFLTLERVYSSFAYLLTTDPNNEGYDAGKELPSTLAGGIFTFILLVQAIAIVFTQSRGPWLGWAAGLYIFVLLLVSGLRPKNYRLLTSMWVALLVFGAVGLGLINTVFADVVQPIPYVGRLAQMLETGGGTGRVRVLIWEGASNMVAPHEALVFPDGEADKVNFIRPLVGYGPEAMWVAFNNFYPPELAQLEARNASPDRSHNETWDSLAITGGLGFVAYVALFFAVFYYALRWLGLIANRRDSWLFLGLWVGMGAVVSGLFVALLDEGVAYFGVALPLGFIMGFITYVTLAVLFLHPKLAFDRANTPRQLLLIALLATVAAHFVEIHFGIAIAASRVYFWILSAFIFTLGMDLAKPDPLAFERITDDLPTPSKEADLPTGGRKGRKPRRTPAPVRSRSASQPSALPATVMADLMIFFTLVFIYSSNPTGKSNPFSILFGSVTTRMENGASVFSPGLLLLMFFSWLMAGLIGLAMESLRQRRAPGLTWWARGLGLHAGLIWGGWLIYGLVQASRLTPMSGSASLVEQLDRVAGHFTVYSWLLILWIVAAGTVFAWPWMRERAAAAGSRLWISLGAGAVMAVLFFTFISNVNISLVRADIYYKQGQQFDSSGNWVSSIELYRQALEVRPTEDHYLLFLGRGYLEQARQSPQEGTYSFPSELNLQEVLNTRPELVAAMGQNELLRGAETVLLEAQRLNPLNTDHTANLARLYRSWADFSTSAEQRQEKLDLSLKYYDIAVRLSPNAAHLWNEKGILHVSRGENDLALAAYEKSLSLDDKFDQTYLLLAEQYERAGEADKLMQILETAKVKSPLNVQVRSYLGVVLARQGDLQGAVDANLEAVDLAPTDLVTLRNLTLLYRDLNQTEVAVEWGLRALANVGGDTATEMQMRQVVAGLYQILGNFDGMAQQYEGMRVLAPNDTGVLNQLVNLYLQQSRQNDALETLQALSTLEPTNYEHPLRIAQIYAQQAQVDAARQFAQQALQLAPAEQLPAVQQFVDSLTP